MIPSAPALVMSALLSSIYGLAYGLLVGKAGGRLAAYVLVGAIGFAAGFPVSERLFLSPYVLGDIPIVDSTALSLAAMTLAYVARV